MILQLFLIISCVFGNMNLDAAAVSLTKDQVTSEEQISYPNFYSWASACDTLPFFKDFKNSPTIPLIISYEEFLKILNTFIDSHKNSLFNDPNFWLSVPDCERRLANYFSYSFVFQPFVKKHIIPAGKKVIFKGDLHADIHSLIKFIRTLNEEGFTNKEDPFIITDDSLHIVFLGDYTDRGMYGLEVIYTILRFQLANPDKVFLVRGNHEDGHQNIKGGFINELLLKLINQSQTDQNCQILIKRLIQMYNFLPACLFLGIQSEQGFIHYIQCCHGGMELGHNAKAFLDNPNVFFEMVIHINRLQNSKNCSCLAETSLTFQDVNIQHATSFSNVGYMWSDFSISKVDTIIISERGNAIYVYGQTLTQELLKKLTGETFKVCAVIRAHQHDCAWTDVMELILDRYNKHPEDVGCGKLWRGISEIGSFWDGIVCTLMLSPDNILGNGDGDFPPNIFDYWATLHTAEDFSQWQLTMRKNNPYENRIE